MVEYATDWQIVIVLLEVFVMTYDTAEKLKSRIRDDLKQAMKAKRASEIALLRSLIGEIENSEAVPVGNLHDNYTVRRFGEPRVEVARRSLSLFDLQQLLRREQETRLSVAEHMEKVGQRERAEQLRREAVLVQAYLDAVV